MNIRIKIVQIIKLLSSPFNRLVNDFKKPETRKWDRPVKLNVGCGSVYMKGWVNIDMNPNEKVDILSDFRSINNFFTANSVSEIYLCHTIGYLNLWEAVFFFENMYELLEVGGKIVLEFPDVEKCARVIIDSANDGTAQYLEAIRAFYAFDMDQIIKKKMYTPYSFGWSSWHLKMELAKIGYQDIKILDPETHEKRVWRDTRIEAIK